MLFPFLCHLSCYADFKHAIVLEPQNKTARLAEKRLKIDELILLVLFALTFLLQLENVSSCVNMILDPFFRFLPLK